MANLGVSGYVRGASYVGGVAGMGHGGTLTNCYNTGEVSGTSDYVGGVAGYVRDGGTLTNCYNTGSVRGADSYVGGVAGSSDGSITNCYRLQGCVVKGTESGLGTQKTAAGMKYASFVTLLNASQNPQPWTQDTEPFENQGYPILNWQTKQ